jgi:hypothetical protein
MGITRRTVVALGLVAAAVVVVGCERGDTRLDRLAVGISKDSALVLMAAPPRRNDPYLSMGQYIEALYFPREDATDADAADDRRMSPVIVINGTLSGWGWAYWDSVASAHNIPLAAQTTK